MLRQELPVQSMRTLSGRGFADGFFFEGLQQLEADLIYMAVSLPKVGMLLSE